MHILPYIFLGLFVVCVFSIIALKKSIHINGNCVSSFAYRWYLKNMGAGNISYKGYMRIKKFFLLISLATLLLSCLSKMKALIYYAILLFFLPEIVMNVTGIATRNARKKEVAFLKRLFILNGSIQPVAFDELIGILEYNASYLKRLFERIAEGRKRNSENLSNLYLNLSKEYNDVEISMFLEKLSQTDRLDFKEGLRSIETDFKIERLTRRRQSEKLREWVEIIGLIMTMILTGLLAYYLILPWIKAYSIKDFR